MPPPQRPAMPSVQYFNMTAPLYLQYQDLWNAAYDNQPVMNAARDSQPAQPGAMPPPQRAAMPSVQYFNMTAPLYLEYPDLWNAAYDNQPVMNAARDNQPAQPGAMPPPQRAAISQWVANHRPQNRKKPAFEMPGHRKGCNYDCGDADQDKDPAIEESFVLRMLPGRIVTTFGRSSITESSTPTPMCPWSSRPSARPSSRSAASSTLRKGTPLHCARPDWLHRRRRSKQPELAPRDRVQMHGSKGGEGPFASAPDVIIFKALKVRITLDARKTVGTSPKLTFLKKGNSTSNTIE
jgi:hypothetical protein